MLYRGAQVLIMDEPTAVLAPQETEELFPTLRAMTDRGESIVFISHKLDEVVAIADRVTVLRRGKVTAEGIPAAGQTRRSLARLMVGRDLLETIEKPPIDAGSRRAASWTHVDAQNDRDLPALRDVSLEVRAGEIVAIAGVTGQRPGGARRGGDGSAAVHRHHHGQRDRRRQSVHRCAPSRVASRMCPRTGTGQAVRRTCRSPTT